MAHKIGVYIEKYEKHKIIKRDTPYPTNNWINNWQRERLCDKYLSSNYEDEFCFIKADCNDRTPDNTNAKRFIEEVYSKLLKIFTNGLPNDHNGIIIIKFNSDVIDKKYVKPNIYKKFLKDNLINQTVITSIDQTDEYIKWEIDFNNKPTFTIYNQRYVFFKYKYLWERSINPLNDEEMNLVDKTYDESKQQIADLKVTFNKLKETLRYGYGINIECKLDMPLTSSYKANSVYTTGIKDIKLSFNNIDKSN